MPECQSLIPWDQRQSSHHSRASLGTRIYDTPLPHVLVSVRPMLMGPKETKRFLNLFLFSWFFWIFTALWKRQKQKLFCRNWLWFHSSTFLHCKNVGALFVTFLQFTKSRFQVPPPTQTQFASNLSYPKSQSS